MVDKNLIAQAKTKLGDSAADIIADILSVECVT